MNIDKMIYLVVGRQGSGKTLWMVYRAYKHYLEGLKVYSNIHLKFPYKKLDYNKIVNCEYKNAVIIIDEAQLLLSSRRSMSKVSISIVDGFISMARKNNLKIYLSTQFPFKVDIRIREEKDFMFMCERHAYIGNSWCKILNPDSLPYDVPVMIKIFIQDSFDHNTVEDCLHANPYYPLYDTSQVVRIENLEVKK